LLILGKKKKRKSSSSGGSEPDQAPGEGAPSGMPPLPSGGVGDPTGGWIKSSSSKAKVSPPLWNDYMAQRARDYMEARWAGGDRVIHGAGTWFILQRDAAMMLWPRWDWPKTITDEKRTVPVPPGIYVPTFVYNAGDYGPEIEEIWINLRSIAWDIIGYVPVT